jgi:HSP20 family molecular chaperone IbpA
MSLILVSGKSHFFIPIHDPSCRDEWAVFGLGRIPQKTRDGLLRARIDLSEEPDHYVVRSELPGVMRKDLWVTIIDRTLSIYAGVTGEEQADGSYCYAEELLDGIRGEIALPELAFRRPRVAEFGDDMLHLVFQKKTDEFLEHSVRFYGQ